MARGAAWWSLGGGASLPGGPYPAGALAEKKAHCGLQMVHGLDWRREKGMKMKMDRLAKTASTHPHFPSPIDPHDSTTTEESRGIDAGGREVGKSSMYSWVTTSRSEPQGEAKFTLNGKQVYPVTSALVRPNVVISVSLNFSASFFVLLTIPWSASHFCLLAAVRAQLQSEDCHILCLSFKEACQK